MLKTEFKLQYSTLKENESVFPVIIVAAGSSARMAGTDKQLLSIGGIPVLARTVKQFEDSPYISNIIIVTRADIIPDVQKIVCEYGFKKVSDIVSGGADRHASVLNGIKALGSCAEKVLIHDGARPFVSDRIIKDCATALSGNDGCLAVIEITDTVKKVTEDGTVADTLDRTALRVAQTPQGVDVKKYIFASESFADTVFTDDASVLERAGYTVKTVKGSKDNIKITVSEDIPLAEFIASKNDKGQQQ